MFPGHCGCAGAFSVCCTRPQLLAVLLHHLAAAVGQACLQPLVLQLLLKASPAAPCPLLQLMMRQALPAQPTSQHISKYDSRSLGTAVVWIPVVKEPELRCTAQGCVAWLTPA